MAQNNKSSDIKKKAAKALANEVEKEVKKETRKKLKKTIKKIEKPEKEEKKENKQPGVIHQFIPFILFALALFVAVCIIGTELADADMGIAGNFISMLFCGLFGLGAFLVPVVLVYMGIIWFKSVESGAAGKKLIFASVSALLICAIVNVIATFSDDPSFNVSDLWIAGTELSGGGVIGGLVSSLTVLLFKSVGAIIVLLACLIVFLMLLLNITPKYIITRIKYKKKLREEEAQTLMGDEPEEDTKQDAGAQTVFVRSQADTSEGEKEKKEEKEPKKPLLRFQKKEPGEERKKKPRDPMDEMPAPGDHDDDDGVCLEKIFNDSKKNKTVKDGMVAIDLSSKPEEKKKATEPAKKESAKKNSDVVLNMKEDEEALSDLESLRGDEKENAPVEMKKIYAYPPTTLLHADTNPKGADVSEEMNENATILRETLKSFNIGVKDEILCSRGPTITRYELRPDVGVRVRSIANLVDDISLSLATSGVRIEAPIPNKPYVGIEVPNRDRLTVFLRTLIEDEKFMNDKSKLIACLGSDVGGHPVFFDITKMPHLLIAGATGMGKSVCINSIIMSILYKATPDEVKLILIDPKKVEFNIYKDIPHLYAPIVSDPKKAAGALASAVAEMERRFELIEEMGVRDINGYNSMIADDPTRAFMPKMVIIIDELADLMMTAPGEVESSICRLAQKARAAGIHIIIGTQRPSVDVITGLIKANVPSRIACTVASQVDSRTIIDIAGAEKLIGKGDMLFAPVGLSKPMRVQGCFVSDGEVEAVVEYIKAHNKQAEYNKDFISIMESEAAKCGNSGKKGGGADDSDGADDNDPKFREAVKLAIDAGKISTSLLQRMIGVGYGRAAKLIDRMEALGYVSEPDGNKPRRVLITMQEYMEKVINDDIDSGEPGGDDEE